MSFFQISQCLKKRSEIRLFQKIFFKEIEKRRQKTLIKCFKKNLPFSKNFSQKLKKIKFEK